jgi:hypothetical protein
MFVRPALITILVLICSTGQAQESANIDGPKGRFQDDLISMLEGNWNLTRKIGGTEVSNAVTAKWVLNHQFLQVHMKDVKEPPAYEAIVFIGYIHATRQYVAHWVDVYGGKFSAVGAGTRSGNCIEFRFAYPDGPFFNTFNWLPESNRWVMRLESQDSSGRRIPFALDTLERAK